MNLVLVGELNPLHSDPKYALWPHPPNCAGDRLRRILDVSLGEYIATPRYNLCTGRWSTFVASESAELIREKHPREWLVLLGVKVAAAFERRGTPAFALDEEARLAFLPHPSGRCRVWNDPLAAVRARELVERVITLGDGK